MRETALAPCRDYDGERVYAAVKRAAEALGGLGVLPGETVFLKVNLVGKYPPESAACTHPAVAEAVAKLVLEAGGVPVVGDSAGGIYSASYMNPIYEASGMRAACERCGAKLNADYGSEEVEAPEALACRRMVVLSALVTCDKIINIGKFKTHNFTGYTGAAKNMFGAIAGLEKIGMHGKYPDVMRFSDVLVDIDEYFRDKTAMHFVDAVVCMEGAGPTAGTPREVGRIAASRCPYSVDLALLLATKNDYLAMPVILRALQRGLLTYTPGEETKKVLVSSVAESTVERYKNVPVMQNMRIRYVPRFLQKTFYKLSSQRPVMKKAKCRGCEKCKKHCPPGAITMVSGKAQVDYEKCIRCFCCQELCPFRAVKVKTPLLARLYRKIR